MKVLNAISVWFAQLTPRDQKILRFGLPIIALILILGSLAALVDARSGAQQRWQQALALEPRLPLLLSSSTPSRALPANFAQSQTEGGVTTLQFSDALFGEVVDQIADWERSGGTIQQLRMRRSSDGRVSGEIRGRRP